MPVDGRPRPIRVVHILGGREGGGIASHLLSLARHADRDAVSLQAIVLGRTGLEQRLAEAGIPTQVTPKRGRGDLTLLPRLARALRHAKPHIVHTHSVTSNLYGRLAARLGRVPAVVTTVHGFVSDILRHNRRVPRPLAMPTYLLDLKLSCFSDKLIAVSNSIASDLAARGIDPRKVITIPNGVDVTHYQVAGDVRSEVRQSLGVSDSEPLIGTVGWLVPLRNHALLLSAAGRVLAEFPDARFVLVGDGYEGPRLRLMADQLGIADRVIFAGFREDVPAMLAAMDIFAMSCDTEGFGLAALEAMAAGLPVVATRVGALPELVEDSVSGLLIPRGDAPSLAEALLTLLRTPELAKRLGRRGRERAEEHYSAERMAQQVSQVYVELAARHVPPRDQAHA